MSQAGEIIIFTDGAARQNPGPGGWGAIVVMPDHRVVEIGGAAAHTTNNKMEMTGAIEGLMHVRQIPAEVKVYTDSAYLVRGITQWIHGWRHKQWMTSQGQPVMNRELWERLDDLVKARGKAGAVQWFHVPGHAGVPGNERCDEIATALADGERIELFDGPLGAYDVEVHAIDRARTLTAARSTKDRAQRSSSSNSHTSYLSFVGGELQRHATWADCESRVRGVSGAKFKKAKSIEDEAAIARSWGCEPLSQK